MHYFRNKTSKLPSGESPSAP